ncbi:MAG: hypothetical protein RR334_02615 [Clostridia bacterium]
MMKKFISSICAVLIVFAFVSCADSNKTLARNIEKNVTNMVYAAKKLETVNTEQTNTLANNAVKNSKYNYSVNNAKLTNENAPIIIITDTTQIQDSNLNLKNTQSSGQTTQNTYNNDKILTNTNNMQFPLTNTQRTDLVNNSQVSNIKDLENRTNSQVVNKINTENLKTSTTNTALPTLYSSNFNTPKNVTTQNNNIATTNNINNNLDNTLPYVGAYDATIIINSTKDTAGKVDNMNNKRNVIMLYSSDIANGDVSLTSTEKQAITEYIGIIEETTNFFKQNRGMLNKQINQAESMSQNSTNMINSKLIRATETLKNRYAKFDSGLAAMESIIGIIENKSQNTYTENASKTNLTSNDKNLNTINLNNQTTTNQTSNKVVTQPSTLTTNQNNVIARPLSPTIDNEYNYNNTNYVAKDTFPKSASKPYRTNMPLPITPISNSTITPIASSTNAPVNKNIVVKNMPYVTTTDSTLVK